jgi:hypothetical protein
MAGETTIIFGAHPSLRHGDGTAAKRLQPQRSCSGRILRVRELFRVDCGTPESLALSPKDRE